MVLRHIPIIPILIIASTVFGSGQTSSVGDSPAFLRTSAGGGEIGPPSTGGIVALDVLLHRLGDNRRALVIGAHPDDEDTGFLALVARGYGAQAAYLSLCRGEGGQNLVGDELGIGLGVLRTEELAAARLVDGALQFFTRAYDFGFSKSLQESSRFWLPDSILKDVVRVMRRFRPHVVVSVFTGTPRDGHGQHQLAGVAAHDAFAASGDPARFPELKSEEGLDPWTPLKLYTSARFSRASTTLELPIGDLDPRTGRTYFQIAMESRSQHRSQDMGRLQPIGPASSYLHLVEDRTDMVSGSVDADELFLGVPAGKDWLASFADSLRSHVTANTLFAATGPLIGALTREETDEVDAARVRMLGEAVAVSAGLVVDARTSSSAIVAGQTVEVIVEIYNAGPFDVNLQDVELVAPESWQIERGGEEISVVRPGDLVEQVFAVSAPPDASPSQPYYLNRPLIGSLYDWSHVPANLRGVPSQPPLLSARVYCELRGASFAIERTVSHRHNDQAVGEMRLPLRVVPAIDVKLSPENIVWPLGDTATRTVTVMLESNGGQPVSGMVELEASGFLVPGAEPFDFLAAGESAMFRFDLAHPIEADQARTQIRAVVRTDDGRVFDRGVQMVSYQHVQPSPIVREATAGIQFVSVQMPRADKIGYVRGAADRVPDALGQLGLPLELLDGTALATADLALYDAIVVGSRAYETDTAIVNHNDRLLRYVSDGGLLVVMYQQYQFAAGAYAPYDMTIARPHDRITDENAAVTLLERDHPAFTRPNRIDDADWEGWPQERGLYFAGSWDDAFTPLLEMADPDTDPVRGGLLVARYGQGVYVYTGLSFFRAIPAGVPGAYRLLMNLLDLGAGDVP